MMDELENCEVEELGHTSEIGLRAHAPTLADLFRCLAQAMVALTGVEADADADPLLFEVDLTAVDLENLLVDWLNEVLYLHEVSAIVPQQVTIHSLSPQAIETTITGRRALQFPDIQIKAVTYHQLRVLEEQGRWKAEVFFDI
jgi:SHS2 domain-containing protein